MSAATRGWMMALVAASISSCVEIDKLEDYPCPDGGTSLSYENFGKDFLDDWCNGCHSAKVGERQGAPEEVRFDSVGEVRDWKERIFERAALGNVSMPPGNEDPPSGERKQLAEWLACGAP